MAEAVGLATSVIAIIELSVKVGTLCLDYSTSVNNARDDIARLRSRLEDLGRAVRGLQKLLGSPDAHALTTSRELLECVDNCALELGQLQSKLDPNKTRKSMRRFGFRALKWPFDTKDVNQILTSFERYERTITLSLQVDQTTLLLDIGQRMKDISLQPEKDASMASKPYLSMPFQPDPDFIDRPEIITWMKEHYRDPSGRMALLGMGGFGKSQLAIQFAHHIRATSPQTGIFWVYASSKQRFQEAYRSIADQLQLPKRNDPDVDVLGLVRDWFQKDEVGPWLIVLDNVDDVHVFYPGHATNAEKTSPNSSDESCAEVSIQQPLASFLPKRHNGVILVTSRSLDAAEKLTGSHKSIHKIPPMNNAQALQLLQHKLEGDYDKNDAAELIQALDHIPLAITQATAYINRRAPRMSVATYLKDFRRSDKRKGNLLNCDAGDLRRDETVSNSVVTTWQVTFEQIQRERPSAAHLLSFMSFFNPQGIPEFAIRNYQKDMPRNGDAIIKDTSEEEDTSDEDCAEFEDDLDVLRGYSLVSMAANRDTFEMHSLVQLCTRIWLSAVDTTRDWERIYLWVIAMRFPKGNFENWPRCRALMPHIESIMHEPPQNELHPWMRLLTNCGRYLNKTGSFTAAERLARKALETSTSMLGEEHPRTLSSMSTLSYSLWSQGRWKEAEELEVRLVELEKKVLGDEHPETLTTMSNLALTYRDQARWKEAEVLQVRIMEQKKKVLGDEHSDTLISMSILATIYGDQGRWKEAEELEEKTLQIRTRILGEEHPNTLTSMSNLASTYWNQGRWNEAEKLEAPLLELKKKLLGDEHPSTLISMANLASTYRDQGQWEEAEELDIKTLEIRSRVLGEEHPATLITKNNLAVAWHDVGKLNEAIVLMKDCVSTRRKILGPDHPDTQGSMRWLEEWTSEA
ncbi:hypothetical protein B0J13DRAFT_554855 [Dactylonectria estremocensis]|uniref:Uncharacterized protein n=1 Tax=Dactylonectria estremocensis TaxID=1079267 RepID=A0A9P9ETP4_9HYPO|nr:hypothetical protein B0J13DRAFT_554855 [Dactylonectria estremocensis]